MKEPNETSKEKEISFPKIGCLFGLSVLSGALIASLGGWYISVLIGFMTGSFFGFVVCLWTGRRRK